MCVNSTCIFEVHPQFQIGTGCKVAHNMAVHVVALSLLFLLFGLLLDRVGHSYSYPWTSKPDAQVGKESAGRERGQGEGECGFQRQGFARGSLLVSWVPGWDHTHLWQVSKKGGREREREREWHVSEKPASPVFLKTSGVLCGLLPLWLQQSDIGKIK